MKIIIIFSPVNFEKDFNRISVLENIIYTTIQILFGFGKIFLKELSNVHKGCNYLIQNTVKQ